MAQTYPDWLDARLPERATPPEPPERPPRPRTPPLPVVVPAAHLPPAPQPPPRPGKPRPPQIVFPSTDAAKQPVRGNQGEPAPSNLATWTFIVGTVAVIVVLVIRVGLL